MILPPRNRSRWFTSQTDARWCSAIQVCITCTSWQQCSWVVRWLVRPQVGGIRTTHILRQNRAAECKTVLAGDQARQRDTAVVTWLGRTLDAALIRTSQPPAFYTVTQFTTLQHSSLLMRPERVEAKAKAEARKSEVEAEAKMFFFLWGRGQNIWGRGRGKLSNELCNI